MTKVDAINAEMERLHEMSRTTIMGDVTYAEVFERIVILQKHLLLEAPSNNKFELVSREWAKGCTQASGTKYQWGTGLDYPWACKECTDGFLEAIYKLASEAT
jgi:hypothetical protein